MKSAVKKVCAVLCSIGACLTLLSGSVIGSETAKSDAFEIRASVSEEPKTLDPTKVVTSDGATYAVHLFDNLMRYQLSDENAAEGNDDNDSVKKTVLGYGQAQSCDISDDGLEYTFTLRDDIFWSDGQPVKADDFVYSWRRLVDPANAAGYGFLLSGIVTGAKEIQNNTAEPQELGVEAVGEKTFKVHLASPCAYFLELCSLPCTMPLRKDVIEKYGREWTDPEHIVTNGPFLLSEWDHDDYIRMTRNEKFYDPAVPDVITWTLASGSSPQLASFIANECDFFTMIPRDMVDDLRAQGSCHVAPMLGTAFLYLSESGIPDWRVRAAITLAIDRQNIIDHVTQSGELPATGLTPKGINTFDGKDWTETKGNIMTEALKKLYPDADLTSYSGQCELAQKLMEEAVADGFDRSVHLDYQYPVGGTSQAIGEAVQSDLLSVLGLNITLTNVEGQTYLHNLQTGNFTIASSGWNADYDDPKTFIDLAASSSPFNSSRWSSEEYDALLRKMEKLSNGKDLDELLTAAEQLLFSKDGFPFAPLYFYTRPYCIHDNAVRNVGHIPTGGFLFTYASQWK